MVLSKKVLAIFFVRYNIFYDIPVKKNISLSPSQHNSSSKTTKKVQQKKQRAPSRTPSSTNDEQQPQTTWMAPTHYCGVRLRSVWDVVYTVCTGLKRSPTNKVIASVGLFLWLVGAFASCPVVLAFSSILKVLIWALRPYHCCYRLRAGVVCTSIMCVVYVCVLHIMYSCTVFERHKRAQT